MDFVAEGSIRWADAADGSRRVRIISELIDVGADTQVWSSVYERRLDDVFQIQSEIAQQIVRQLGLRLGADERKRLELPPTENLEAYQAFMRGNHYSDLAYGPENLNRSVEAYERAVELDPQFHRAWVMLSLANSLIYHMGFDVTDGRRERAFDALERAAQIRPDAAETHVARGYYHYWGFRDYERALYELGLAGQRNPNDTRALSGEAYVLRRRGRFDEALGRLERVGKLDPRNPRIHGDIGATAIHSGRYDEAFSAYEHSLALRPSPSYAALGQVVALWSGRGRDGLAQARATLDAVALDPEEQLLRWMRYMQSIFEGRPHRALDELQGLTREDWLQSTFDNSPVALLEAIALELDGRVGQARQAYLEAADLLEAQLVRTPEDFRIPGPLGLAYAALGRNGEAVEMARRGYDMMPIEQDAILGPARLVDVAIVQTIVGDEAAAIAHLSRVIGVTGMYSVDRLELDPRLAALRDHPDYVKLRPR